MEAFSGDKREKIINIDDAALSGKQMFNDTDICNEDPTISIKEFP